jgi:anti-sigma B factor antagonist
MALEIATREQDGISILELSGRLVFGPEDMLLDAEIRKAIAARKVRLVIELSGITKIDSSGWGTLLAARTELRNAGGALALANLHPAQMKMLRIGKMESLFDLYSSEQEAIDSFFAALDVTDDYGTLAALVGGSQHSFHKHGHPA